uniref:Uncharacterized protein n=1 Tax=Octopus bimaculoides TaxID=37653 RepID=A0A0L8FXR1_OCTBM
MSQFDQETDRFCCASICQEITKYKNDLFRKTYIRSKPIIQRILYEHTYKSKPTRLPFICNLAAFLLNQFPLSQLPVSTFLPSNHLELSCTTSARLQTKKQQSPQPMDKKKT